MKKIFVFLCLFFCTLGLTCFVGCGGNPDEGTPPPAEQLQQITGVTFESFATDYDGTEKELLATNLPDGVSASYSNNTGTDAGTYNASVTLSGEGFRTLILQATLTINKIEWTGNIELEQDEKIYFDGKFHFPTLTGLLPDGAVKEWKFDNVSNAEGLKSIGEYLVNLVIKSKNYTDIVLNSTFKIARNFVGLALRVINAFGSTPEPWSFLPESFSIENKTVLESNVPDYVDFTNVSSIPDNYIGKQLNVVYGVFNKCSSALEYVNILHGAFNVIQQTYQAFLDDSTSETTYSDQTGDFTYTITLGDESYSLDAQFKSVRVSLFANLSDESYGARIQLTDTTVLKYTVSDTNLKIAMNILNVSSTLIDFTRNSNGVKGYIYECLEAFDVTVKNTSALIEISDDYTTVVGTKGDFIPTSDGRNCEVYSNATGKLVGTEVSEVYKEDKEPFDTLWYNLKDISGITTIKKVDNQNKLNKDTIFINNDEEGLHTTIVGGLSWTMLSRRYDIEFKEVCAYVYDAVKEEYNLIEFEVPMMFIQEDFTSSFSSDFKESNNVVVSLAVSTIDKNAVYTGYYTLVNEYNFIKQSVTKQNILDFCEIVVPQT